MEVLFLELFRFDGPLQADLAAPPPCHACTAQQRSGPRTQKVVLERQITLVFHYTFNNLTRTNSKVLNFQVTAVAYALLSTDGSLIKHKNISINEVIILI